MIRKTNRKTSNMFSKHWLKFLFGFLLLLFGLPPLLRYLKNVATKAKENKMYNEAILSSAENSTLTPSKIKEKAKRLGTKYKHISPKKFNEILASAQNLSIALGTNATSNGKFFGIDMFPDVVKDWSALTEDEDKAVKILKKYPGTFEILEDLYSKVATRGRNLKKDIHQYLSASDIIEVKEQWKKFGDYNWL